MTTTQQKTSAFCFKKKNIISRTSFLHTVTETIMLRSSFLTLLHFFLSSHNIAHTARKFPVVFLFTMESWHHHGGLEARTLIPPIKKFEDLSKWTLYGRLECVSNYQSSGGAPIGHEGPSGGVTEFAASA